MDSKTSENIEAFLKKVKPRRRRSVFWDYLNEIDVLQKRGCSLPQICDYLKITHGVSYGVTSNNLYGFLMRASNIERRGNSIEGARIGQAASRIMADQKKSRL